ncbi:MAG: alpha/beta hydrolase [Bradyrhizobium sp.]|nr:alpha/beta hydrolase [Bradyrhizobium sp.]
MIVAVLAMLALCTEAGVFVLERRYPQRGKTVDVTGAALNVVELGPDTSSDPLGDPLSDPLGPPILLLHGASSNLEAMRKPLGEKLAKHHRVILIDRPGHGWSVREHESDSTPQVQARMIEEALSKLDAGPVIVVVHSLAGALGARIALDYPERVAGLVMLAPVTHPWYGGVGFYNSAVTTPIIGPLLAYTVTLPLGLLLAEKSASAVFAPQAMPENFVTDSATPLLLRPREFLCNARDLVTLKAAVTEQSPRYGDIKAPVLIISGDVDKTVSTVIHSRMFAKAVPNAKLIVLPGIGHMIQNAVPDLVVSEIEAMMERIGQGRAAAAE